ncbi:MAG TPA: hypothetical protein PK698_06520 [Bacilli bacterium]|nr:hypothetical protein [Bacilli bacterium]
MKKNCRPVEIKESSIRTFLKSEVVSVVFIISTAVGVIMFFMTPSMTNKTALQLQEQRIISQEKTIADITKTQQNDTQEVKAELKEMKEKVEDLKGELKTLTAIINERIPAKK